MKKTVVINSLIAGCAVFLAACNNEEKTKEASWESLKTDAKETLETAVDLSKEKWDELKAFSVEEWSQADDRIKDLRKKVKEAGDTAKPEVEKLMSELETLREKANRQMKEFSESSGDEMADAREKLEETWKKIREKFEEIRDKMEAQ